jgi:hypothetical protein
MNEEINSVLPPAPFSSYKGNDSETHFVMFALEGGGYFQKLLPYKFQIPNLFSLGSQVNEACECGSSYRGGNTPPYLTIMPVFSKCSKGLSPEEFLKRIFADVIKSHNNYFRKPNIVMVYSERGFPNLLLFEKEWQTALESICYSGVASFFVE